MLYIYLPVYSQQYIFICCIYTGIYLCTPTVNISLMLTLFFKEEAFNTDDIAETFESDNEEDGTLKPHDLGK